MKSDIIFSIITIAVGVLITALYAIYLLPFDPFIVGVVLLVNSFLIGFTVYITVRWEK